MADTDTQPNRNGPGEPAAGARRTTGAMAEAGRQTADAAADTAQAGVEAERRSFAAASDAGRQGMQTMDRAASATVNAGQQAIQRAGEQASEFWRASLNPMAQLQNEFGRWVEHVWRQASPTRLHNASPFAMSLAPFTGQPLADLHETDQALELRVELPGMKPEDVRLMLQGDTLIVSGEKAEEIERGQGAYRVSERRFGRFERSFVLPPEADRNKIEAKFGDGLLKVTIAKIPGATEAKLIPIGR
ncbi:MAG: small heat shock protein [Caulobacteraceae bacterium]|nr:small heat shock protein [Caulobacteraceae bacterium]